MNSACIIAIVRFACALVITLGASACGRGFFNPIAGSTDGAGSNVADASVPITYVQGSFVDGNSPVLYIAFPVAQRAGDLALVVASWVEGNIPLASVQDVLNSQWMSVLQQQSASGLQQAVFVAPNIASGQNTISVQFSSSAGATIVIAEYAGIDPVQPLDRATGNIGDATSMPASGMLMTTHDHDLLIGIGSSNSYLGGTIRTTRSGCQA